MSWIMVDIEADGPIPGPFSMISFGAVLVEPKPKTSFKGELKPISDLWNATALAVSGYTREDTLKFDEPKSVMYQFAAWIDEVNVGKPMFISDNNGFDWQFINWYFHRFYESNPFGHSSTNLGSLYKGLQKDTFANFKHLRKTKHTHDPVDDAMGNVEALNYMISELGLKFKY